MIINQTSMDRKMPVGIQQQEIARIQKARAGELLFPECGIPSDVIDTLLFQSDVSCITLYIPGGTPVRYVKES